MLDTALDQINDIDEPSNWTGYQLRSKMTKDLIAATTSIKRMSTAKIKSTIGYPESCCSPVTKSTTKTNTSWTN